ncbi:metal-sulfur cluster assembly factor [Azorhizobium doebereinerae]|uniref:metal-sulfur cluster assembly factor n=1 Tax=Azorhizobium doebereinerae TaxID=281091 RepID=UPI0004002EE7|nr:metal-sulfur cluster assembly factor [Azorhizobium doebereinerae]
MPMPPALDPELLSCLEDVLDPEVGLSVVDLGLVYRASRSTDAVDVAISLTTRACPLGEMILDDIRERISERFGEVKVVNASLVWDPPWTPDRITDRGLERLGRPPRRPPDVHLRDH